MRSSIYLTLAAIVASVATAAPLQRRSPAPVYRECSVPGTFALTFDDGPYQFSWDLAKSLHSQGIPATFFVNGKNWINVETDSVETSDGSKTYMDVLRNFDALGHQVASHTYEHKQLGGLSAADIEYQMNTNADIIEKAIGKRPTFMRPPAGEYDDNTLEVLGELNYHVIMWDLDSLDWATHSLPDEQGHYVSVMGGDSGSPGGGHISLQHEVYQQTVDEFVPWIIEYVKSKNYSFVTVADCLGISSGYV
ncbi:hypothetical protein CLU79DRAFT_748001 [Phycomyces nitens]|nr:hypothetical protein CLU79DRAFT_748001 [Phycomyces nitens]